MVPSWDDRVPVTDSLPCYPAVTRESHPGPSIPPGRGVDCVMRSISPSDLTADQS
jgi:hypothetical protein